MHSVKNQNGIKLSIKNLSFPSKSIKDKIFNIPFLNRFSKPHLSKILHNISLDIDNNHSPTVILGPSGSGKSTLLRCINFLEKFEGEIYLNNIRLCSKSIHKYRKNFGFVFQESGLFPNMTALENIIYTPIKIYKENKEKITSDALELLQKLGIYDKRESYPNTLSGGEKQKVAIARSLVLKPKILFFDEPTSALDSYSTEILLEILNEIAINTNTILVIVTHDIEFGKKIANRVIHFSKGSIEKVFRIKED